MARLTNTFVSDSSNTNREQLSDVVDRIDREDTPIYSMMGKRRTRGTHPEWSTDELATPGENFVAEGDEAVNQVTTVPARLGNYTQIMRKVDSVTDTQQAVDDAGSVLKVPAQKMKKAVELKRDIEFAIVNPQASVATDPRRLGSLPTWLETNVSRDAGGSNGGYDSGTGLTTLAGDGTQRALTKALIDTVMESCYTSGAKARHIVLSPYAKTVFTTLINDTNTAAMRFNVESGGKSVVVGNVDVYKSPHGDLEVHANHVMATNAACARNAYIIDPSKLEWLTLRPMKTENLARTTTATKFMVETEGTLCVKNEKGIGVIADLYGLTASS